MPFIPKTHQISIKLNLVSWGNEGLEIGNTWALAKEWRCCRRELRDYQLWVCAHSSWPDPLLFPSPARFGFWLPNCFTLTVSLTITEKSCGLEGEGTNLTKTNRAWYRENRNRVWGIFPFPWSLTDPVMILDIVRYQGAVSQPSGWLFKGYWD